MTRDRKDPKPAPMLCINCEHLTMDRPDHAPDHLLMLRCNKPGWAWTLRIVPHENFNVTDLVTPHNCPIP